MKIYRNNLDTTSLVEMEQHELSAFLMFLKYYGEFLVKKDYSKESTLIDINNLFTKLSRSLAGDSVLTYLFEIIMFPEKLFDPRYGSVELNSIAMITIDQDRLIREIVKGLQKYEREVKHEKKSQ